MTTSNTIRQFIPKTMNCQYSGPSPSAKFVEDFFINTYHVTSNPLFLIETDISYQNSYWGMVNFMKSGPTEPVEKSNRKLWSEYFKLWTESPKCNQENPSNCNELNNSSYLYKVHNKIVFKTILKPTNLLEVKSLIKA